MPRSYLLSRTLDPLLGVFTGFLAYYLHETNPRTAPPQGHTLKELVQWQAADNERRREAQAAASAATETAELEAVRRELQLDEMEAAVGAAVTKAANAAGQTKSLMVDRAAAAGEAVSGKVRDAAAAAEGGVKKAAAEVTDRAV